MGEGNERTKMRIRTPVHRIGVMENINGVPVEPEPMLFAADIGFCDEFGGDLTRAFVKALPADWQHDLGLIIDSRVHMLKPGWFPAIPGWHLDEVPRDSVNGQPDLGLIDPETQTEHIAAIVDTGSLAFTEFLIDRPDVFLPPRCPEDHSLSLWQLHDAIIESASCKTVVSVGNGELFKFGFSNYHRAVAAKADGWRFFIRATRKSRRKTENKIRRQTQVYLSDERRGW